MLYAVGEQARCVGCNHRYPIEAMVCGPGGNPMCDPCADKWDREESARRNRERAERHATA